MIILQAIKIIALSLTAVYAFLAACGAARRKDIASTILWCTLWIVCAIALK